MAQRHTVRGNAGTNAQWAAGYLRTPKRGAPRLDHSASFPVVIAVFVVCARCDAYHKAEEGRVADVFISYAHRNARQVARVTEQFQGSGLSLWWDDHLRAGDDFALKIEREIDDAGAVLVMWSDAARNSLWVRAEATEALDNDKLVQARLDGVKPPLPFTIVQMVDLRGWRGKSADQPFPQLLSAITALKRGVKPSMDERVFYGPALQDFGSAAALGWISLALIFATSGLTLMLGRGVDVQLYELLTTAAFGASCLLFVLTFTRLLRTALASRRS